MFPFHSRKVVLEIQVAVLLTFVLQVLSSGSGYFCEGKQGVFAAPSGAPGNIDCRGYYKCLHGNEPMTMCLTGTRFSDTIKNCDWADAVECSQSVTTTGAEASAATTAEALATTTIAGGETFVTTVAETSVTTTAAKETSITTEAAEESSAAKETAKASEISPIFLGYFSNWFQWWEYPYKFRPEHIVADKLTHLNYATAMIHSQTFEIIHFEDNDVSNWGTGSSWNVPCHRQAGWCQKGQYEQVNDLKQTYPRLKTLISIGGWIFNSKPSVDAENTRRLRRKDPTWDEFIFSNMVSDAASREKFVKSAIQFCRNWNFDGVDLDWEYPSNEERGGRPADKANFALLLKELRIAFEREAITSSSSKLLLTAAVGIGPSKATAAYDVKALDAHLDFINLMTYDTYGGWDPSRVGIHSQLYAGPGDAIGPDAVPLSGSWAVDWWIEQGARREKLNLGLAMYTRSYVLASGDRGQGPGAAAVGYGAAQRYTKQAGTASYYEVRMLIAQGAVKTFDRKRCGAYLQLGTLWMGFDDEETMRCKAQYVKDKGLRGAFVWDLPEDDFPAGSPLITAYSEASDVPQVAASPLHV